MISENIRAFLASHSGITTLVSNRIRPIMLPQKTTFPAITYRASEHELIETFEGQNGLTQSLYMIDSWAATYAAVVSVGDAVRTALKNHSGDMGGVNVARVTLISGPVTVYEDEVEAYRQTQIFSIWHKEV